MLIKSINQWFVDNSLNMRTLVAFDVPCTAKTADYFFHDIVLWQRNVASVFWTLFTLSHHVILMMRLPCTQNALFGSGLSHSYWSLLAEVLKLSVLMVGVECFRHNVFYLPFLKVHSSFWIREPELLASAIGDEVGPWIFQSRGTIWLLQNNGWIL